ncbi:MAG: hypothetical protein WBA36_18875 [Mesorhizobium sp.]
MPDLSPIMKLFREFEAKHRQLSDLVVEDGSVDDLINECESLEERIIALPVGSAQDLAAKLITYTRYGDFTLDDVGKGGPLDELLAIVAVREHPDAKLIELGQQFEAAKAKARSLEPAYKGAGEKYGAAMSAAGISDFPLDRSEAQQARERELYRDTGFKAASDAFNAAHHQCVLLMKAIHRTKATTLEGFAVKAAAIAFDQGDFELDPKPSAVAERMLFRMARSMAKVVKSGAGKAVVL